MSTRFCERCQKTVPERGQHFCVKAAKAATAKTSPNAVTTPVTTRRGESVTTGVTTPERQDVGDGTRGDKARVYRWRAKNRERYNSYMAAYRRERRAAQMGARAI
jgi:hypothetical protein